MTDYTTLSDTTIDSDKVFTKTISFALRDNPIAITEGSTGAPKIQTAALNDSCVTTAKILDDNVTGDKIESPGSGTTNTICRVLDATVSTTTTTYKPAGYYVSDDENVYVRVLIAGTVTCELQHRDAGGDDSYVRIMKNTTQVNEWSTSSTSFQSRSVSVSVAVGDVLHFQQRSNAGAGVEWRNIFVKSTNATFAVG